MLKKISILGSTGSIGTSTLEVIRDKSDRFEVVALAAGTQVEKMITQIREFQPKIVCMATQEAAERVKREVQDIPVLWGEQGLVEVATYPESTHVVAALVGSAGLYPVFQAVRAGKIIGLANKETLVVAGHLFKEELKRSEGILIPVDSEHSAIFQCLNGERRDDVTRIIITASGGSFRDWTRQELKKATVEQALNHPNWSMGSKITIDSATMMNKGLEVIEAHWLFDIPYEQIDVVLHPQSLIHSMVEFQDGAVMAQLGTPDMRVPIQYALTYPERLSLQTNRLDFKEYSRLDFMEPDLNRYPCLRLAIEAGRMGGTTPAVLNAANETAVASFLSKRCSFLDIESIVSHCLELHNVRSNPDMHEIFDVDRWARRKAEEYVAKMEPVSF